MVINFYQKESEADNENFQYNDLNPKEPRNLEEKEKMDSS